MYIKLNKNNNKSISISIYNNTALIYEVRYLTKIKCPAVIEYFDISKFIYENSLMISDIDYSEVYYSYICCDKDKNSNLEQCNECVNLIPNSIIINADSVKKKTLEIYYLTKNIIWNSSYNIILEKDLLSIESWFNITNKSGLDIENASIKLITGDVSLPPSGPVLYNEGVKYAKANDLSIETAEIQDHPVYILENKYDLPNNTVKRIANFKRDNILYNKIYEFGYYLTVADIKITFSNTAENNLGIVFSYGNVNTYGNYNNKLEFLGGNYIPNTGINRDVSFVIGKAFDVTAERKIVQNNIYKEYTLKEVKYIITNTLNETIRVSISEPIFAPYHMDYSSDEFINDNNGNPNFIVEVPENSKKYIMFTYRYENKTC